MAGIEASRGMVVYGLSKGAVIGITLPMARDLGKYNIRVVTLAPQIFTTPMGNLNPSAANKIMIDNTPLGRLGNPPEFADAVESICLASYLTGTVIRLDGGVRTPHIWKIFKQLHIPLMNLRFPLIAVNSPAPCGWGSSLRWPRSSATLATPRCGEQLQPHSTIFAWCCKQCPLRCTRRRQCSHKKIASQGFRLKELFSLNTWRPSGTTSCVVDSESDVAFTAVYDVEVVVVGGSARNLVCHWTWTHGHLLIICQHLL